MLRRGAAGQTEKMTEPRKEEVPGFTGAMLISVTVKPIFQLLRTLNSGGTHNLRKVNLLSFWSCQTLCGHLLIYLSVLLCPSTWQLSYLSLCQLLSLYMPSAHHIISGMTFMLLVTKLAQMPWIRLSHSGYFLVFCFVVTGLEFTGLMPLINIPVNQPV